MRRYLRSLLARAHRALKPIPDPELLAENRAQRQLLNEAARREANYRDEYAERAAELIEARQLCGAGPWLGHESRTILATDPGATGARLRESNPITSIGAYSDIELALQNVEWRREVNLSWLEFSRWGIQQIILICRLYYIKNPIVRRLIDVCAAYVFARGVEVATEDEDANLVLADFFARNKTTLGQIALVDLERRKDYDGNLFFVLFSDTQDGGETNVRTIDATEIMDIICDPNDSDKPWYYRRSWVERNFDPASGVASTKSRDAWYPALYFEPSPKPQSLNGIEVRWDSPVHHRKCGGVAKWHFGCPRVYPMVDWAKASKKFLEACATVKQSLAQISMTLTTKGGQQAIEGVKQQLETSVGTGSSLWDTNPAAVGASIFASGPGTQLSTFNTKGGGGDPEEVRQFKLMCCMVKGVPETFLGDVSTGNLATATSLDRPTETMFLELQEAWVEDLGILASFVLTASLRAPSGKLREALKRRKVDVGTVRIAEAQRVRGSDGRMRYVEAKPVSGKVEVKVNFPAIREGDVPALIHATVEAVQNGRLDAKVGVKQICDLLPGVEDSQAIVDEMWPATKLTTGPAKDPSETLPVAGLPTKTAEKIARRLVDTVLKERNGLAGHHHS